MATFEEFYKKVTHAAARGEVARALEEIETGKFSASELDCLLHPERQPLIWHLGDCACPPEGAHACIESCPFEAIAPGEGGNVKIDSEKCLGCAVCIDACKEGRLMASRDILPALRAVRAAQGKAYALIAPAFLGQFAGGREVTPGKLRTALKKVGFGGMVEVALFADILTLKEAFEFDHNITREGDFQLTSCCCPMWIAMIKKVYHELMPHVPGAVSPMIAAGRTIKALFPDAVTVFIGPCLAKKAEAREADLAGAVDYVLTFQEIQEVFDVLEIRPEMCEDSARDHSSYAGRIYARAGGVSEAVTETVRRISPHRTIAVRAERADGVSACREMLKRLQNGESGANFFEGMGCAGGCVGGPKVVLAKEQGAAEVQRYADGAEGRTPMDNPYVVELLRRLGVDTVEGLLENTEIFTRNFHA